MDPRRSAFHILKPICVRVSEIAVNLGSGQSSLAHLDSSLAQLLAALKSVQEQELAIDRKLADYVFFPLSSVFRERQRLPSRHVETALQCLSILLSTGWSSALEGALAVQLLLMLTFVAAGPPNASPSSTQKPEEELQRLAFSCQNLLFEALRKSGPEARESLLDSSNVPSLGHAFSVLLDAARDAPSVPVQLAALEALYSMCQCIADRPVLASFIPGIVSSITRVLTPATHQRQPYRALLKALDVLTYALKLVYADSSTFPLPVAVADSNGVRDLNIQLGEAWLKASAAQIRMALANVMRLRTHERQEVRLGLRELCFMILEECSRSLAECTGLAIENLFVLHQIDADSSITSRLADLVLPNPDLLEPLKLSLYDWLTSMPRLMLSNDDELKSRTMGQIAASFNMLAGTDTDLSVIDDSLLGHLQDSTAIIAKDALASPPPVGELVPLGHDAALELHSSSNNGGSKFPSIFNYKTAQTATVSALTSLVHTIASSGNSRLLAQAALDQARLSTGSAQVTNTWLALNLVRRHSDSEDSLQISDILNFDMLSSQDDVIEEDLYSFALSILTRGEWDDEEDTSWQLQALALETLALRAFSQQSEFRPDLVDALYPVVHHLGSPIPFLRRHATIVLNSIAQHCAYSSAQTLLVENADYLVNAIGNKISSFDIEPQTPQVLRMLAKLCGPRLIGYLDDVVDAIFEALDCFHSYPSLVEVLFSALGAMVEESAKANVLQPDGNVERSQPEPVDHHKPTVRPSSMSDLTARLGRRRRKREAEANKFDQLSLKLPEQTPQRPWADLRPKAETDEQEPEPHPPADDKPPPLTKPYETTLRIATSIQYHLTSPSPSTRLSLLRVLLSAVPYLSRHEDSFLPLINALWPVLAPRLRDNEVYIVCATLHVMGAFAVHAGDFMSGRFEKLWPELKRLWDIANHSNPLQPEDKGAHGSRMITAGHGTLISSQDLASIASPSTIDNSLASKVQTLDLDTSSGLLKPSNSKSQDTKATSSSGDLLRPISTRPSDPPLMEVSSSVRNTDTDPSQAKTPKYEATTIIHLRHALVTLSTHLLTHVRLDASMRSDIEAWLLPIAVDAAGDDQADEGPKSLATKSWSLASTERKTSPEDVRRAIADTNPDLLWLAREQALWRADPSGREQLWEERRQALPQETTSDVEQLDWDFEEEWARCLPGTGLGQVQWARMVFATS